jgi:hypothetical protein
MMELSVRDAEPADAESLVRILNPIIEARVKGYEKISTFVRADNRVALQAYLGQGFQVIGTAIGHARIDGRYIDEILIEKDLAVAGLDSPWETDR